MTLENFKRIIDESQGRTFQVALGGRGDPDRHPDFIEMLKYCHSKGVTPNFTTSGYGLDHKLLPEIKKYCGAVAVSHYRSFYTTRAIHALLSFGIKTNIHFVLGNQSLDEAIDWIENKHYPKGINRIIFLLHKLGSQKNILDPSNPKVKHFYALFNEEENCAIAGFDTCTAPALIHNAPRILKNSFDTCEGGRFSAYVTPDFKLLPCSFDVAQNYGVDLRDTSIEEAFNSVPFEHFRSHFTKAHKTCQGCIEIDLCMGGCPLMKEIVLCEAFRKEAI